MDVGFGELIRIIRWQMSKGMGRSLDELTLGDRVFKCPRRGLIIDRDLNAGINILRHGGVESRPLLPVELHQYPWFFTTGKAGGQ
ncbi:transposase [Vulcanisaeta souniana]|uniref:transposase n=1 Tax=Vulcanisaeta souniana TaxID=164452 RepID=UPI0006CF6634|nr:transposase [Vulcanisaeta souniana]